MPELPEVETVVRDLAPAIVGRRLSALSLSDPRVLTVDEFAPRDLVGRRLQRLVRRGKYILYDFGELVVLQHLRMTGQMLRADAARFRRTSAAALAARKQLRATFAFADTAVHFVDTRRFGTLALLVDAEPYLRARLGPEPLAVGADALAAHWGTWWRNRRAPVKNTLLDQRSVAGIGNIYADEALFLAGIDPRVPAGRLGVRRRRRLAEALQTVLHSALAKRGTSMSDYLDFNGNPGVFRRYLNVYRRAGEPCRRCGDTAIRRCALGGRSAHYCPRCQRR